MQTHLPLPRGFGDRVVLEFRPEGYSGQAPVGGGELNLCLVSVPGKIAALREWAEARFEIPPDHSWRTITPLRRAPIPAGQGSLFLVGDAARVVEPFTGEGIYYALASAELAAKAIRFQCDGQGADEVAAAYSAAHRQLYRGRLWINRLARAAVLSPPWLRLVAFGKRSRFQPSRASFSYREDNRQALTVFAISIAIVIGPTPPGTGVIAEALADTSSNATSPTSR